MDKIFGNLLGRSAGAHERKAPAREVHLDVLQSQTSSMRKDDIKARVRNALAELAFFVVCNNSVNDDLLLDSDILLTEHVEKIGIQVSGLPDKEEIDMTSDDVWTAKIHVYQLINDGSFVDILGLGGDAESNTNVPVGRLWRLPNVEFEGLWENLIYDENIKGEALRYAQALMLFADQKVDPNIVSSNRLLLFHGPPGTGKTTLCRSLAQKLFIRNDDRYKTGHFLEVNTHNLFSKWFAASGKLVSKLFEKIRQLLEDETALVVVLIDGVESLTVAREQALSGNEPSDAIRVVNALLTQIDYIRKWPNVLILTTSNLMEAIDPAFLDRVDINQYIGFPSAGSIYHIFCDAIEELRRAGIVDGSNMMDPQLGFDDSPCGVSLKQFASRCAGFSGRLIRKLPMLACAYKLGGCKNVPWQAFFDALDYAIEKHGQSG